MSDPKQEAPEGEDRLLNHRYDGIQEFDNPMPRWWVWIYWGSFWFSLAYIFHYTVGHGVSVEDDYAAEVEVVNAQRAQEALKQTVSEETLLKMVSDATIVEKGAVIFKSKCVVCHKEQGQGSIGPNLTDAHWIHGKGAMMDIHEIVSEGSAAKGMPAWKQQLPPADLKAVIAFVGTLRGTNIEGKAPEGEPIE